MKIFLGTESRHFHNQTQIREKSFDLRSITHIDYLTDKFKLPLMAFQQNLIKIMVCDITFPSLSSQSDVTCIAITNFQLDDYP